MKNRFRLRKAEDILTDDFLVEELGRINQSADLLTNDELRLANRILQAVSEKDCQLNQTQKELIGKHLIQSINSFKRKKLIVRISTAAVFILVVGLSMFFTRNSESDISAFARNNQTVSLSGNTRLILSGEEIQINTEKSTITYAGNGNEIQIDSSSHVQQVLDGDKVIYNTVLVPYGKRTQVTLSDNSSIWLNSGSKLIYPARFAADKREVYLEGEAIFEVSHNKERPFHVVTRNLEVKVLGTVFNVSAYNDDATTNTILESGSVELNYKGNSLLGQSKETMVPGMLAVYDPIKGSVEQTKVNTRQYTAWRDGYFVFEQQALGEIIKKVSRYYNVSIQLNDLDLADETFTGNLDLGSSATQVLEVIAEILNAQVKSVDNHILITRN